MTDEPMRPPPPNGDDYARDGFGKFIEKPDTQHRDAEAFRLRARGATFEEIAVALGYYNKGAVANALKKHLATIVPPAVEEYRAIMDAQLDELYRRGLAVMDTEHFTVSNGQLIYHPEDNEFGIGPRKPLMDDAPVLSAMDRLLKIQHRRAALWGLDAPSTQRIQVQNVRVTVDGADDV